MPPMRFTMPMMNPMIPNKKQILERAWEDKRLRVSEQLQCACCCLTLTAVEDVQMKYFEYKKESMKAEVFKT